MPAIDDLDPRLIAQHGSHPTVSRRHGGERGDRIELTEPGGGFEQVLAGRGDPPAELAEEGVLARDHRTLRVEDQCLIFLELGRDVALAVDERLLAHVLGGDRLAIGVADLEVIAEHLVESDFERSDARPLAFVLFQGADPVAGSPRSVAKAIELGVVPGLEDPAVFQRRRNIVDQRPPKEIVELLFGWRGQRAGQLRPFGGRPPHARQRDQRLEQAVQVAWGGDPLPGSRGDAFQVRQAAQRRLQLAARQRIFDEQGHAVEPLIERRPVPQWLVEPAPKLAGTHRRNCLAQHQADEVVSRWCALGSQPQALAGRRVEMHVGPGMLGMQAE